MKTPEQWRQRRIAGRAYAKALRLGQIRPRPEYCERCGKRTDQKSPNYLDRMDAHHPDYYKPLEIRWLCHECHLHEDVGVRAFDRRFDRVPIHSCQFMVGVQGLVFEERSEP